LFRRNQPRELDLVERDLLDSKRIDARVDREHQNSGRPLAYVVGDDNETIPRAGDRNPAYVVVERPRLPAGQFLENQRSENAR